MINNFSPISFTSTYKFNFDLNGKENNIEKHWQLQDFCEDNNFYYNAQYYSNCKNSRCEIDENSIKSHLIIDDTKDDFLESFCLSNGIKFNKIDTGYLLDEEKIISRMVLPITSSEDMEIVLINAKKLNKVLEYQKNGNIEHCNKDYNQHYKEITKRLIKSGDKITAPSLYINSRGASAQYVKTYGYNNIHKDSLMIDLCQRTDKPEHCLFFAFQELGMEKLPVCVNKNTKEYLEALDILE